MFILKIIAVSSAILWVGHSMTQQCEDDQMVEFDCQSPTCVNNKISWGQLLIGKHHEVNIVGTNANSILINTKDKLKIIPKNHIRIKKLAEDEYWKYKVYIHKKTYKICELNDQNTEENYNSSNVAQITTNTDDTIVEISDKMATPEINKNADVLSIEENKDVGILSIEESEKNVDILSIEESEKDFDIISIEESEEDEDESDLESSSFAHDSSNTDSIVADNLINDDFSVNNGQIPNSDLVNFEKSDLNEKITKNKLPKPTNPQKLENDSSADCTLDSCVKNLYSVGKKVKESFVTNEQFMDSSYQQNNKHLSMPEQLSKTEKIDSLENKTTDNTVLLNSETADLQDDNIGEEELNTNNFHQHQNLNFATSQQPPSTLNTKKLTKKHVSIIVPQNPSTINNNGLDKLNKDSLYQQETVNLQINKQPSSQAKIESSTKESTSNYASYSSNTVNLQDKNNGLEELDGSYQEENVNLPINQQPPSVKTSNVLTKDSSVVSLNSNMANLQDTNSNMELFNETQQQDNSNSESEMVKLDDQQDYYHKPSLQTVKTEMSNESVNLPSNPIGDNLQGFNNESVINESHGPLDVSNDTEPNLSGVFDGQRKFESQSTHDNQDNIESTSNNNLFDNNTTYPLTLQQLTNETGIISSNDDQTTTEEEINTTEKSTQQCISENGCLHSVDIDQKYTNENIPQQYVSEKKDISYESVHKHIEHNSDEKPKKFEPKSIVESFGHPDTCSGVGCLKFKRNLEKTIKSQPQASNSVSKQEVPDVSSHLIITNFQTEIKNVVQETTEQLDEGLGVLDHFQNWISSPTLNTIHLLSNIFGEHSSEFKDIYPDQSDHHKMLAHDKYINHSELCFIVVAIVTLIFSFIYCKYQRGNYENNLLTLLAAKDEQLLILKQEFLIKTEQEFENTADTTIARNSELETLNDHFIESEDIISSQNLRIEKLEQEVNELTENGMEMHALLSSTLDCNAKNKDKLNTLKVKLTETENLVTSLTQKNFDITTELEKRNDRIKTFQLTTNELTHKNMTLVENNAKLSSQLEHIISKNSLKESKLRSEINNLKCELDQQTNALVMAENEVLLSKNALQDVLSQKFNLAEAKQFLSSVKLSAELKSAKQICEEYKQKFEVSNKSNQQNLDYIEVLKNDIANLENNFSKLEKKNEESINKLNILTIFFKEQEKEYLKQINEKAMLCNNKEGESSDLHERIKCLNQEISNYKLEIQSLKKEITDQENSYKIQISVAEKKASDYWISFRQAERKLKEMELETSQLRNKLTMVDKKLENGTKSIDSSKDFEDDLLDIPLPTVSPDFTLFDFEPLPPILTNERLPPLGALGQASSPPVPLSRRHNRSLSPSSPPPPPSQRSSVFRPLPQRYNYMNRQNSLGHSVESLDK